jgi:hypothetical protein
MKVFLALFAGPIASLSSEAGTGPSIDQLVEVSTSIPRNDCYVSDHLRISCFGFAVGQDGLAKHASWAGRST